MVHPTIENQSAIKRNLKKHYTKWKQQDTKDYISVWFHFCEEPREGKFIETESRSVLAWAGCGSEDLKARFVMSVCNGHQDTWCDDGSVAVYGDGCTAL